MPLNDPHLSGEPTGGDANLNPVVGGCGRLEAGNHPTVRVAAGFSTISAHCGQPDARSREVTGPDNGEWPPLIVNSI